MKMSSSALDMSHSLGPASQLFMALIQSMVVSHVNVSPSDMWPKDYGPYVIGNFLPHCHFNDYLEVSSRSKSKM